MASAPGRQKPLVMIVDDDYHHLLYATNLLQRFQYRICPAKSSESAVELALQTVPALVLTELDLPQMSGLDLLYRLRSEPGTAQVPVVALTANCESATTTRCIRAGFSAVLRKPVSAEELFRVVQAAVEPTPRANLRIHARLSVTVNNIPLDCVEGECASVISEHGMYIRMQKPHPPKSHIAVRFDLNGRTISADGVVLYSHRHGEGPFGESGMGIKFESLEPRDRDHLRTFINAQVTGGTVILAQ